MILRVKDDAGNVFDIPAIRGLSSYEIAVKHGFEGTEKEWLASISAVEGLSAYEVAREEGFEGTEEEWLASLVGPQGAPGLSAYEVALNESFEGSEADWLASLVGPRGPQGETGAIPTFSIGTVKTVDSGVGASATITGTAAKPILNLNIPKGEKGDKGDTGETGAAGSSGTSLPTVSSSDDGKFLRVVTGSWEAVEIGIAEEASF